MENSGLKGSRLTDSPEIFVGSVPIWIIDTRRDIGSIYLETSIPIVGSEQHITGIYNLELDLAGRHDHYEGVSEDANVPKIMLRYQPIPDLTLRGTFSNSFVAPNLYQLFGPVSTGFFDGHLVLRSCLRSRRRFRLGSNPDLIPSTAQSSRRGWSIVPSMSPV